MSYDIAAALVDGFIKGLVNWLKFLLGKLQHGLSGNLFILFLTVYFDQAVVASILAADRKPCQRVEKIYRYDLEELDERDKVMFLIPFIETVVESLKRNSYILLFEVQIFANVNGLKFGFSLRPFEKPALREAIIIAVGPEAKME